MRFYSQLYHESVTYAPKRVADPIVLHWEKQNPGDRQYKGKSRIDLHPGEIPSWIYGSGDGLRPVGVYVVLRGRSLPDGIYAYDRDGRSGAPDVVGQLVRIGCKAEMESLLEAFPDKEFVKNTRFFTFLREFWSVPSGVMARVPIPRPRRMQALVLLR
uniref:Uncharacterized protein n=1 Tax=uncultured bacterium fosmid pJB18D1_contig I TaxID=1478057 RepID=A0A0H3U7I2_9BACT|nr:hypothetical protein [uncultured bacterium fosmid pJB18D1_contig I]